jgi:Ca-activated chloride channel family protein
VRKHGTRRQRGGLVAAAIGVALTTSAAGQTFRADIDLVRLPVTVTDRRGAIVTDLTRDDFIVLEDGRPQTVTQFSAGLGSAPDAVPTRLGLLLDTSASMEADIRLSRSAAIKFLNALPEAEDITLVDFDTEVRVARYGQRDFARLVERIRGRKPDGFTALYDALGVYLDGADTQTGRKILVVCTDGGDTRSALGFGDLITLLKASDVTVYAVGFLEHQGAEAHRNRMRLQQIVEPTGGLAFFPGRLEDLDDAYARIVADVQGQYLLGYESTSRATDGAWRKVAVTLKRPGLTLRARKGYFARYLPPAPPD